jgi:proline dehydrogenase
MSHPLLVKVMSALTLLALKVRLPLSWIIKPTIFRQFCGGETLNEAKKEVENLNACNVGSILDYSVEAKDSEGDFENTKREIIKIISMAENNEAIPYTSLKVSGIISSRILEKVSSKITLSDREKNDLERGKARLDDVCQAAYSSSVPVYFDAEESWIQAAIDSLAEEMMLQYNKERAIVLTTLQMYRTDRIEYLRYLIRYAGTEKIFVGIKLVRGAYMEKENQRALSNGLVSPIHVSKENTDRDFDQAVTMCLEHIDIITLCAGTHNEASTLHLLDEMKRLKIGNSDKRVFFSQLYGMSDNITYNLATEKYNVTKYLPYGPIKAVIPYLIRRAQENTAIAGQMGRELKMLSEEKIRRSELHLLGQ